MLNAPVQIALIAVLAGMVLLRRHDLIIATVFISVTADVVAFTLAGPNVPAFRALGLFVLPWSVRSTVRLAREYRSIRLTLLYVAMLFVLGVVFGYLAPWSDTSGMRPWQQQAPGRAIISVSRHIADLSLAIYLADQARRRDIVKLALAGLCVGLVANVVVAATDMATGQRLINLLASAPLPEITRQGGLNGEPRALGKIAAVACLYGALLKGQKRLRVAVMLAGGAALVMASSTSALGAGAAGAAGAVAVAFSERRWKRVVTLAVAIAVVAGAAVFAWRGTENEEAVATRVESVFTGSDADTDEGEFTSRLEVFDRAAARFLLDRPEFVLLGTGPDLISLPASLYMSASSRTIYGDRIDTVPSTGVVSVLANAGLLGLLVVLGAVAAAAREGRQCARWGEPGMAALMVAVGVFAAVNMSVMLWVTIGVVSGMAARIREARARVVSGVRSPVAGAHA